MLELDLKNGAAIIIYNPSITLQSLVEAYESGSRIEFDGYDAFKEFTVYNIDTTEIKSGTLHNLAEYIHAPIGFNMSV